MSINCAFQHYYRELDDRFAEDYFRKLGEWVASRLFAIGAANTKRPKFL